MINIWEPPYPWRLRNLWANIKYYPKAIKWAKQRIKRGWADCDTWNFDYYLLSVIQGGLAHLADNHFGWPSEFKGFPTDEDWTAYLKDMADLFYKADENNDAYPHPAYEKWAAWTDEHSDGNPTIGLNNPYSQDMVDEDSDLGLKRQADFEKAWDMMGRVFWDLWD